MSIKSVRSIITCLVISFLGDPCRSRNQSWKLCGDLYLELSKASTKLWRNTTSDSIQSVPGVHFTTDLSLNSNSLESSFCLHPNSGWWLWIIDTCIVVAYAQFVIILLAKVESLSNMMFLSGISKTNSLSKPAMINVRHWTKCVDILGNNHQRHS